MREFKSTLRIGNGPWCIYGACKTYKAARVMGIMFAKSWLGVAESDVESDCVDKRESIRKLVLAKRKKAESRKESLDACLPSLRTISAAPESSSGVDELDEIDKAEMDREYRENIWNNHDCDPTEESFEESSI